MHFRNFLAPGSGSRSRGVSHNAEPCGFGSTLLGHHRQNLLLRGYQKLEQSHQKLGTKKNPQTKEEEEEDNNGPSNRSLMAYKRRSTRKT